MNPMEPMNEQRTQPRVSPRKPSTAMNLALLLPGLGHVYAGDLRRGACWFICAVSLLWLGMIALIITERPWGLHLALTFLGLHFLVSLAALWSARRIAKTAGQDYVLREWNSLPVYFAFLLTGIGSVGLGLGFVLRERVVQAFYIPTSSMAPTLVAGDKLLARRGAFLESDPQRGDLVVFRDAGDRKRFLVKRVVATGGDTIEWRENGEVLVNGKLLERKPGDEPDVFLEENDGKSYHIQLVPSTAGEEYAGLKYGTATVPRSHCFVMGDNRFKSADSRQFGAISYASLLGKPILRLSGGWKRTPLK